MLRLVIFDCDGVLVNSEPVANKVVTQALSDEGWVLTSHQADALFLGMTLPDMVPVIEAQLGRPLSPGWCEAVVDAVMQAMKTDAIAIEGGIEALIAVTELGLPWRIASNSSHAEMAVKFACIGASALVAGRLHSFEDVRRGKPAPDLFLATAAAEGVAPDECLVIEDSVTGARAAAAAGMRCLGYAPAETGLALAAVGAIPFISMFELPQLIAATAR